MKNGKPRGNVGKRLDIFNLDSSQLPQHATGHSREKYCQYCSLRANRGENVCEVGKKYIKGAGI